ncbi:MFS transporter [Salipaludibacillus keqinensis]|uniref:MFS transporter n=1 Tax=Salipaludibacillus keqinensis TaxID=2045207 RepID=A0A323TJH5_9BACI|nr:MFS transporter [Salipaludibacillus keqinensis]PYZ94710.1 MFS transporter [Salipaludibacillus keqinensis]
MSDQFEDTMKVDGEPSWLHKYIDSPEEQKKLYKKTMIIVVLSQIFGGAGLAAGITVGALLARDVLGTDSFAGLPVALFTLGSAGAALLVGRLSQRLGRRAGLATGFLAGGIGAIGVVLAAITTNIVLLFVALFVYGAGTATNLQARYAGTDLASPSQRATSISIALMATTFGAVAGPNLVGVMGEWAEAIGFPALSGPFMLAAAAYILAGLVILLFLRPDPFIIAKALAAVKTEDTTSSNLEASPLSTDNRGIFLGASIMVLTQIVMVAIMTMTPVHMGHHGHALNAVGLVISIHVAAMYLPSLVTGILVDKVGRLPMAAAAGFTLLASGILSAVAPTDSMLILTIALALLGLGWNFGLISGTAILVDSTNPTNRAKKQGSVDVFIALAGASGGALSGVIVASTSYPMLSLLGGLLALSVIPLILWFRARGRNQGDGSRG